MKLRSSTLGKYLAIGLLGPAGTVLAQQGQTQQTPAKDTPPRLERIDEGSDVPITVTPPRAPGGTRVTEKREGGRIVESRVNAGGSEYTLRPNIPVGTGQPGDAVTSSTRPPTWTVLEFDLNKKKNTDKEGTAEDAAGLPPAPPPPPPAGTK